MKQKGGLTTRPFISRRYPLSIRYNVTKRLLIQARHNEMWPFKRNRNVYLLGEGKVITGAADEKRTGMTGILIAHVKTLNTPNTPNTPGTPFDLTDAESRRIAREGIFVLFKDEAAARGLISLIEASIKTMKGAGANGAS